MPAVRPERQRFCPYHGIERQIGIKMWKQHAAARRFEAQAVAESFCVDRDEQQIVLAAEIFRGGRFGLLRGRKMNATVGDIGRRAVKPAPVLGFAPQGGGSNFIDQIHGLARFFGASTNTKVAVCLRAIFTLHGKSLILGWSLRDLPAVGSSRSCLFPILTISRGSSAPIPASLWRQTILAPHTPHVFEQ